MNYKKAIGANLLCVALGAAVVWAVQGGSFGNALLFVALLLWLCNELWHAALTLPGLLLAVWSTLRGKECPKAEKGVARAFSLLLLLVPHVLFAVLYGAELLTGGQVSAWLGLPLSHGLFACAFVAPALLCFICLVSPLPPLSVVVLGAYLFEPELWQNQQGECPPVPETPTRPLHAPRHPDLRKVEAELLYYGRPVPEGSNPFVQRNALVGSLMLAGAALMLAMAVGLYAQSLLGAGLCAVLAAGAGCIGLRLVREPARWKTRLCAAEFAFTRRHVYMVEGEKVQVLPIDDSLSITLEPQTGSLGNIYLHHSGKLATGFRKLFKGAEIRNVAAMEDIRAPFQGFMQIEQAAEVCRLLEECRRNAGDA